MLNVIKPGVFSMIQDLGRTGYQAHGIIKSGAMDTVAYRLGNALLQQANKPALEMTLIGGEFLFTKPTTIALTGGKMHAAVNGNVLKMNQAIALKANDRLTCGPITSGTRSYLCIAGGFSIEPILNSTSTYLKAGFGGFHGRALQTRDEIPYEPTMRRFKTTQIYTENFYEPRPIRILKGTEWHHFTALAQQYFLHQPYTISLEADRMGYRLDGEVPLETTDSVQLLSEAVTFGTIQVPSTGQPILLMADHQTTGGYKKIAQVIAADLPRLAQLGPKHTITFELVTLPQAEQAFIKLEQQVRLLETLLKH